MRCVVSCVVSCALAAWALGCGSVQTESCPGLEPPQNGSVSAPVTDLGATASYQCASGFTLVGDVSRTCQVDGTWSGTAPTCVQAQCPQLAAPANGSLAISGAGEGATATYACASGYELIGAQTRTCQGGAWSGADPRCGVRCPCFGTDELDRVQADITAGGNRLCQVDSMGGGTTQTLLMSAHMTHRFTGGAMQNASLPGTHLACFYGCLDDSPNGVNECIALPEYFTINNITVEQHATCRALVMPRCDP
jgi:hypothetical protein